MRRRAPGQPGASRWDQASLASGSSETAVAVHDRSRVCRAGVVRVSRLGSFEPGDNTGLRL